MDFPFDELPWLFLLIGFALKSVLSDIKRTILCQLASQSLLHGIIFPSFHLELDVKVYFLGEEEAWIMFSNPFC